MLPLGDAIHFGAGALGRGLVVPRLVAAGWLVTVVDADAALIDALARGNRYPLVVAEGEERRDHTISIAGACRSDDPALQARLSEATLVTTAVRRENLAAVAAGLVAAWNRHGMAETVAVVGCENVEHVDAVLEAAFAAAGITAEQRARLRLPRTVVDRICASDWPQSLAVTTEPFNELVVSGDAGIAGIDGVADIDAHFARKRFLVNTFADASAILGAARGHRTLAQTIVDPEIQRTIAPLLAALERHLAAAYGYTAASLDEYLAECRRRLANPAIPRRIETVARDIWRKLGPSERFAEPLIDLEQRGALTDEAVAVLAVLVRAAGGGAAVAPAYGGDSLAPAARRFYDRLERALAA